MKQTLSLFVFTSKKKKEKQKITTLKPLSLESDIRKENSIKTLTQLPKHGVLLALNFGLIIL